jgi:preprotein translocase subunit SecB
MRAGSVRRPGGRLRLNLAAATRRGAPGLGGAASSTDNSKATKMAEEQGSPEQQANGNDTQPAVGIITQYVKDLSFENPNAPAVYQWQNQPQINVEFGISLARIYEEIHEVSLRVQVTATTDGQTAFAVDLLYAGLIGMRNVGTEEAEPFLYAEAPRILFPFARHIVSQTVQDGGFPPLLLDPLDFHALYLQREAQGGGAGEGQPGEIGQA